MEVSAILTWYTTISSSKENASRVQQQYVNLRCSTKGLGSLATTQKRGPWAFNNEIANQNYSLKRLAVQHGLDALHTISPLIPTRPRLPATPFIPWQKKTSFDCDATKWLKKLITMPATKLIDLLDVLVGLATQVFLVVPVFRWNIIRNSV